jgi:hypothetical protein
MITRSLEPPRRMVWPRGGKRVDEMAYDNQKGVNTGGHEGRNNSEVLWRSSPLTARIILVRYLCWSILYVLPCWGSRRRAFDFSRFALRLLCKIGEPL